jgi:glycosyltransferase involved in cell wall biosynthesis
MGNTDIESENSFSLISDYKFSSSKLILGIDVTNLRGGGGVTHIIELLTAANPSAHGFSKIIVWGGSQTLEKLPQRAWLKKVNPPVLNKGILARSLWQRFSLSAAAHAENCDVLFVPGGSFMGSFKPMVALSQNLLPFEGSELGRYGASLMALKLKILRYTQSHSFKYASGTIFLTKYAENAVLKVTGTLSGMSAIIPHGLPSRFRMELKVQRPIEEYSDTNPYRLLYVSSVDQYKHQWHLIEAVSFLRKQNIPVKLDLVGPAAPSALIRLNAAITKFDPENSWVRYQGAVPYEELNHLYAQADLGVFASSCENMPIILLEKMASGLPIACSNCGPMPEVLGNAGLYFDPESPSEIMHSLLKYIESPELRSENASNSIALSQQYSWSRCADETLTFLAKVGLAS